MPASGSSQKGFFRASATARTLCVFNHADQITPCSIPVLTTCGTAHACCSSLLLFKPVMGSVHIKCALLSKLEQYCAIYHGYPHRYLHMDILFEMWISIWGYLGSICNNPLAQQLATDPRTRQIRRYLSQVFHYRLVRPLGPPGTEMGPAGAGSGAQEWAPPASWAA